MIFCSPRVFFHKTTKNQGISKDVLKFSKSCCVGEECNNMYLDPSGRVSTSAQKGLVFGDKFHTLGGFRLYNHFKEIPTHHHTHPNFQKTPAFISLATLLFLSRLNLEHLVDITEWKEGMVREPMGTIFVEKGRGKRS